MAIRTVITRGYGNGTFNGTIGLVVLRGYIAAAAEVAEAGTRRMRQIKALIKRRRRK